MKAKINNLVKISRQVIKDCVLSNGAIVAANSKKKDYPKDAKNYRFVWPRDSAYTLLAANILDLNIHKNFFDWCLKAEGFFESGVFYEKYYVNGKCAAFHFQPDQTGMILFALHDYYKNKDIPKKYQRLIIKAANGLCNLWNKDHFKVVTQDLWEERLDFPDLKENFTYSLASCAKGLSLANELIANKRWKKVSSEMKKTLLKNKFFFRSFGKINNKNIDASLLGLVWPFEIVKANDKRMKKTVQNIEKLIVKNNGVYRYENDEYDGWMYKEKSKNNSYSVSGNETDALDEQRYNYLHRKKGAGYWPLLNFWMSIYYIKLGDRKKALMYYNQVLKDVKKYIPEQIFDNKIQISVSPLCWSHAMFILASKELGFVT